MRNVNLKFRWKITGGNACFHMKSIIISVSSSRTSQPYVCHHCNVLWEYVMIYLEEKDDEFLIGEIKL